MNRLSKEQKYKLLKSLKRQVDTHRILMRRIDAFEQRASDDVSLENLLSGLTAESESGKNDGIDEQELGRLENVGELSITIRSPIEIIGYMGQVLRSNIQSDNTLLHTVMPDEAYTSVNNNCWQNRPACSPKKIFTLNKGKTPEAVYYAGEYWHTPKPSMELSSHTREVISILQYLRSLSTQTDDLHSNPRVTVLP